MAELGAGAKNFTKCQICVFLLDILSKGAYTNFIRIGEIEMFNKTHILYMIISAIATSALLVPAAMFIKNEKWKNLIIRILAVVTVVLHFSNLYVEFFTTGAATIGKEHLLPVYPCHIMMWLLLICAFLKKRDSKVAKVLQEFTFYVGTVCALAGLVFNENFASNPTLSNWYVLKGLISHSTLIAGCIYIMVAGFIKCRVSNCISVVLGLCLFLVDGAIINALFAAFNLKPVNAMYLQKPPMESMPWATSWLMGLVGVTLLFIFAVLYEQFALPEEERWYVLIKNKVVDIKTKIQNKKGENK